MIIKVDYTLKANRMLVKWLAQDIGWTNPTQMTTDHILNCIQCFWVNNGAKYINPLILDSNPQMELTDYLDAFVEELRARLADL